MAGRILTHPILYHEKQKAKLEDQVDTTKLVLDQLRPSELFNAYQVSMRTLKRAYSCGDWGTRISGRKSHFSRCRPLESTGRAS